MLEKRVHPVDCRCAIHDLSLRRCSIVENGERCERVCRGPRPLGSHISAIHRKRKTRAPLRPSGTGYLQKTLRNVHARYQLNVASLPRFAQTILQGRRPGKMQRRSTRAILLQAQENPQEALRYTLTMPGAVAEIVALLALEANVPVSVVTSALLSYGVELLAQEIRKWKAVPDPRLPLPRSADATWNAVSEPPRVPLAPTRSVASGRPWNGLPMT